MTVQESADYVNGDDDFVCVPGRAWGSTDNNNSSNEQHVPNRDDLLSSASSHTGIGVAIHDYYYYYNNNTR